MNCRDVSNGHYNSESTHQDVLTDEIEDSYPLTGPILVEDCKPGDVLQVSILDCEPSGFGWTAIFPDFGLLQDDFEDPYLRLWNYDQSLKTQMALR